MIWNIILVVFAVYYINKWFFGFGAERNFKKALKEAQERLDEDKKSFSRWQSKLNEDSVKEITKEIEELVDLHDIYLHLKEKSKHSLNEKRKIENDWLRYTEISLRMREYDRDFMMLLDEKTLEKIHEKRYEDRIKAEEIKKRLKKLFKAN